MNKPRKWWVAGLLSFIKPGLGQLYNGQLNKAIFIILLGFASAPLLYLFVLNDLSVSKVFLLAAIYVGYYIVVIADSIVVAKKTGSVYVLKKYNKIYVYIAALIILGAMNYLFAGYVKHNFVEAFKFPSRSMEPTLLVGDHLLVNRSPSARNPQRGDIVVFEYPEDPEKNFLKRVVAIGGDNVELRNGVLYVNGKVVNEPYIKQPKNNKSLSPSLSGSNYGPVVVPDNSYFVLGDNRDNSQDSRYFGFVSREKIKGTARSIYWSWDKSNSTVRWNRIGALFR
jgi:signal peptidase I